MKLPASPEANQKQNAVIVVVQPPAAREGLAAFEGLERLVGAEGVRNVREAVFRDLAVKMRQWAEYSTCFLLADERAAQGAGDLTEHYERLEFTGEQPSSFREGLGLLLEAVWEQNFRRVAFVDAFAPSLPAGLMRDAFEWLWERDVVLGPNLTGGCYLIGLRDLEARVLPEMSWHKPAAFMETVEHVRSAGLTLQLVDFFNALAELRDVPYLYAHLAAQAAHGGASDVAFEGGHTFEALHALAGGEWLLADERFRALLAADGAAATTTLADESTNGNHAGDNDDAPTQRRPAPTLQDGAPAPLPGDLPPRRRR